MTVVQIWDVRMRVRLGVMPVPMRVRAFDGRLVKRVGMVVVSVCVNDFGTDFIGNLN